MTVRWEEEATRRPDLALTKQAVRPPAAGAESAALCCEPQLLTWLCPLVPGRKGWQDCDQVSTALKRSAATAVKEEGSKSQV